MSEHVVLQIHKADNVGVATSPLEKGQIIHALGRAIHVQDDMPRGHKLALKDFDVGDVVIKYGFPIGRANCRIKFGQWVHTHNVDTTLEGKLTYQSPSYFPHQDNKDIESMSFPGYLRSNGSVGVRNEIWVLNTVGCVNKTAEQLAKLADREITGNGIDGVHYFSHPYGCSQLGGDLKNTQLILAGLARHPNAAGVLIIGLGCENNQIDSLRELLKDEDPRRLRYLEIQSVADEFDQGMKLIRELATFGRTFERTEVSVSKLKIGLKCGGSDAFSGITANPLVGAVADRFVQAGASAILTEVPEMFGAETVLMDRASSQDVFGNIVNLINGFKDYFIRHGQEIYQNPSPGNKDGGITTLEEKSLGCIQKGGTTPVTGVISYGQQSRKAGLQLVEAPGNDMVSVTALVSAGAQIVLFTTGRGTPMGGAVPTIKISSNSELFTRKPGWIDFDAGSLLHDKSLSLLSEELFSYVLRVASGEESTNNERHGFREIAIFKDGVTL